LVIPLQVIDGAWPFPTCLRPPKHQAKLTRRAKASRRRETGTHFSGSCSKAAIKKPIPWQARDRGTLPEFLFPKYTDLTIRVNRKLEGRTGRPRTLNAGHHVRIEIGANLHDHATVEEANFARCYKLASAPMPTASDLFSREILMLQLTPSATNIRSTVPPSSRGMRLRMRSVP
jgi:hypothetical protein